MESRLQPQHVDSMKKSRISTEPHLIHCAKQQTLLDLFRERDKPRVCDVYNRSAERRGAKRNPAEKIISIHNLYHYSERKSYISYIMSRSGHIVRIIFL